MIYNIRRSRWATVGVFCLLILIGLARGRTSYWNDPGTFWHLRLGRDILRTGTVPQVDLLTYSRTNTPWVDQSWGFDVLLAGIVDRFGPSGAIALTTLGLAWIYASLTARLIRDGGSPLAACLSAVFAAGIGSIHFLARPHLFTFAFVLWTLGACRAYHRGEKRALWPLPLVMIVWANVHGGFLAGPLIVATSLIGESISGTWDEERRRKTLGFAVALLVAIVAPLINPYGIGLYRHVQELLISSNVTDLIQEYQPISFGKPESRVIEGVMFALIVLGVISKRKGDVFDWAHALIWLHLALGSIRQAPLFAIAVAPVLTTLVDGVLSSEILNGVLARAQDSRRRTWTLPIALGAILLAMIPLRVRLGGPDPDHWPLAAAAIVDRQPIEFKLFHELEWGGLIESECLPTRRSFIDDRFELHGRRAVLDYLEAIEGGPAWEDLLARLCFDLVWIKPARGLARRLDRDPSWTVLRRDSTSVVYVRGRSRVGKAVAGR